MPLFRKRKVCILSVDGGGVRGIIPAMVLEELKRRLSERGVKKPFHRLFDLMAGTSTGSVIVLGLSAPGRDGRTAAYDISEIRDIYENRSRVIFPLVRFNSIRAISQVWTEKYDHRPLESILEEYFGNLTLKDALTNILITSFDTDHTRPFIMKSRSIVREGEEDLNFYMKDAVRASSAAPTYLELPCIHAVGKEERGFSLVDGGVFANNPAMCAYTEARKIYPGARRYVILSLGTGRADRGYSYEEVKDWGYIDWVRPSKGTPLFRMIMRGQSECVAHQLSRMDEVEYIRINGRLDGANELMDDARESNIGELRKTAERFIMENNEKLERIADILAARRC